MFSLSKISLRIAGIDRYSELHKNIDKLSYCRLLIEDALFKNLIEEDLSDRIISTIDDTILYHCSQQGALLDKLKPLISHLENKSQA